MVQRRIAANSISVGKTTTGPEIRLQSFRRTPYNSAQSSILEEAMYMHPRTRVLLNAKPIRLVFLHKERHVVNPTHAAHQRRPAACTATGYLAECRPSLTLCAYHPLPSPTFDRHRVLHRRNLDVASAQPDPLVPTHPFQLYAEEPCSRVE